MIPFLILYVQQFIYCGLPSVRVQPCFTLRIEFLLYIFLSASFKETWRHQLTIKFILLFIVGPHNDWEFITTLTFEDCHKFLFLFM